MNFLSFFSVFIICSISMSFIFFGFCIFYFDFCIFLFLNFCIFVLLQFFSSFSYRFHLTLAKALKFSKIQSKGPRYTMPDVLSICFFAQVIFKTFPRRNQNYIAIFFFFGIFGDEVFIIAKNWFLWMDILLFFFFKTMFSTNQS